MTEDRLTVGQLRAELVGVPDDVPVTLVVADDHGTGTSRWFDAASAGYGPGIAGDEPAFSSAFPIGAAPSTETSDWQHLVTVEVHGRPATFATAHEQNWKDAVDSALERCGVTPVEGGRFAVRIRFRCPPSSRKGEVWDLDNLVKPTLDAMERIFGRRPWAGRIQPADDAVDWLAAEKTTENDEARQGATIGIWTRPSL